jgi:ABC-type transport system involved in multi-copper enzyme maturation permease subunit
MINLLKSEWRKFASLKSSWVMVAAVILLMAGFAWASVRSANSNTATMLQVNTPGCQAPTDDEVVSMGENFDDKKYCRMVLMQNGVAITEPKQMENQLVMMSTQGIPIFAQIALAVLVVMMVTTEWRTGTIRPSLAATPRRGKLFAGKFIFASLVAFLTLIIGMIASLLIAQATQNFTDTSIWTLAGRDFWPGVVAPVIAALLWTMFCFGLAWICRSSIAALALVMAFCLIIPIALSMGGKNKTIEAINNWTPQTVFEETYSGGDAIGDSGAFVSSGGGHFWRGLIGLSGWTLLSLGLGYALLKKRDV